MHSHFIIELLKAIAPALNTYQLPNFCNGYMNYAEPRFFDIPEGQILQQCFGTYLVFIQHFEYLLTEDIWIDYHRSEPSIFMSLMLKGYSAVYDLKQNLITESPEGTMHMGCIHTGAFRAKIKAGSNKLLLFTLRTDWISRQAERMKALTPILSHFSAPGEATFNLPPCQLTTDILKPVESLFLHKGEDQNDLHDTINTISSQLMAIYNDKLNSGNYTTDTVHALKAKEIEAYILAHYPEKSVSDLSDLASRFNVSERQLRRVVEKEFQIPLYEFITSIRLNKAMELLLTTMLPIKAVAASVGFTNPHYFSTAFKKFHQLSPTAVSRPQQ